MLSDKNTTVRIYLAKDKIKLYLKQTLFWY